MTEASGGKKKKKKKRQDKEKKNLTRPLSLIGSSLFPPTPKHPARRAREEQGDAPPASRILPEDQGPPASCSAGAPRPPPHPPGRGRRPPPPTSTSHRGVPTGRGGRGTAPPSRRRSGSEGANSRRQRSGLGWGKRAGGSLAGAGEGWGKLPRRQPRRAVTSQRVAGLPGAAAAPSDLAG